MKNIKANNKGQISFGANSPNLQGSDNRFNFKVIDKKSFGGGFFMGVLSSLLASYIWTLIQNHFVK
jgi:hypothetical protein